MLCEGDGDDAGLWLYMPWWDDGKGKHHRKLGVSPKPNSRVSDVRHHTTVVQIWDKKLGK